MTSVFLKGSLILRLRRKFKESLILEVLWNKHLLKYLFYKCLKICQYKLVLTTLV